MQLLQFHKRLELFHKARPRPLFRINRRNNISSSNSSSIRNIKHTSSNFINSNNSTWLVISNTRTMQFTISRNLLLNLIVSQRNLLCMVSREPALH